MSVIEPPQRHALLVDDERRSAFFVLRMPTLKGCEARWAQMPQRLSAATNWIQRKNENGSAELRSHSQKKESVRFRKTKAGFRRTLRVAALEADVGNVAVAD